MGLFFGIPTRPYEDRPGTAAYPKMIRHGVRLGSSQTGDSPAQAAAMHV